MQTLRRSSQPYLLSPHLANVSRMTNRTGGEDEKLTAREKRKLRKEFSQLGRDSVRYNVQIGGYGVAQRRELALAWLREQEDEDDRIKRWTLYAAVIAAAISIITLLVTLGVMK
jgi:hypothetical protein